MVCDSSRIDTLLAIAAVSAATVALAIGDPNGVGPEIAVKAAARLSRGGRSQRRPGRRRIRHPVLCRALRAGCLPFKGV